LEQIKRIIEKYFQEHHKISKPEPKNEEFSMNNEILISVDKNEENFIDKMGIDLLKNEENNMFIREKELQNIANIEIKIALERANLSKSAKMINKVSEVKKNSNFNENMHIFGLKNVGNSC